MNYLFLSNSGSFDIKTSNLLFFLWSIAGIPETVILSSNDFITADFAATLLEPYISEKNFWILKHHGIFQGYYFFHFLGLDRDMRDKYKDHEYWKDCAEFCAKYDQNSFDPKYDTLPIETFIPMLERVLSQTKKSIYKAE